MPAHKTQIQVNEKMLIRQRILVFLLSNGFLLVDKNKDVNDINYDYVKISKNVLGIQKLEDFLHGVEFMQGLEKDLNKYSKSLGRLNLFYNWNYLGQNNERENYIDYLVKSFWQNQNSTEIQELYNYTELVENPFKIVSHSNLITNLAIPADFFGNKTNTFVTKITAMLESWNYKPYLVFDTESNFQWSVNLDDQELVRGLIIRDNNNIIWQKYFFGLF